MIILVYFLLVLSATSRAFSQDEDTGCQRGGGSSCSGDSFCHITSELCVCNNGASTYPMCFHNRPNSNTNNCPNCNRDGVCDPCTGQCHCRNGGMYPNCCRRKCSKFEMCHRGRCECMYGENSRGRCRRCVDKCRSNEKCVKRGSVYACQCRYGLTSSNYCKSAQEQNCPPCPPSTPTQCIPPPAPQTQPPATAVPTQPPAPAIPASFGQWSAWGSWSTCNNGQQTRTRNCQGGNNCSGGSNDVRTCINCPNNGKQIQIDFVSPFNKQFYAECRGGCIRIHKIVHDCRASPTQPDATAKVQAICEAKPVCQFSPTPAFFGPRSCFGIKKTWVTYSCNGGQLIERHRGAINPEKLKFLG